MKIDSYTETAFHNIKYHIQTDNGIILPEKNDWDIKSNIQLAKDKLTTAHQRLLDEQGIYRFNEARIWCRENRRGDAELMLVFDKLSLYKPQSVRGRG